MISSSYVLTAAEQRLVNEFKILPHEKQHGYWEKTDVDGPLSELKAAIKEFYLKAQNFKCVYCQQRIVVEHHGAWDVEHIIPKDVRPEFMFECANLCVACKDCNGDKWNKNVLIDKKRKTFPKNKEAYKIFHAHFDIYEENIKIIELAGFYLPLNEKGRATVEMCGLLRFLFSFAGYACVDAAVAGRIHEMNVHLMKTKNPIEQSFWLQAISDFSAEAAKMQREAHMSTCFPHGGEQAST